jgi:ABC-2 type transport system permease protein
VGMLLQPLVFLCVFGLGFDSSFSLGTDRDLRYGAFFYPGILGLVVLFAAIYATLTLVDDKKCGFFRLIIISEAGLKGALIGKISATTLIAFSQSLLFLPLTFIVFPKLNLKQWLIVLLLLMLASLLCALMGVLFAWLSPSSSVFHALMSIILIPMWLLSGAMFPLDNMFLRTLSIINPMAYIIGALRECLIHNNFNIITMIIIIIFSLLLSILLAFVAQKKSC